MNPETPTRRARAYHLLRELGLTHHQTKHLIDLHLSHLGEWRNLFYKNLKADRENWQKPAELIAALSMKADRVGVSLPKVVGESIFRHCWGEGKENPECPYTCASMAALIVADAHNFNPAERRILWKPIERILAHERRTADAMWEDRMLSTYLHIREVL